MFIVWFKKNIKIRNPNVLHLVSGASSRTDFMGHLFNVDEEKNKYFK